MHFGKTVPEMFKMVDDMSVDGYMSMTANMVMADASGNIGFMMLVAQPERKDSTPYIGCRVLDG
jgi:acyl-homoserine lactone acylase PvdQ